MAPRTPQPTPTTQPATPTSAPGSEAFGGNGMPTFDPNVAAQEEKRYSSAIGVEGRRVTNVKTGEVTYEGYTGPSGQSQRVVNAYSPFVPELQYKVSEPKYFVEDLDALSSQSSTSIAQWQMRMNAAGLLGDNFALGVVDNQTRSAYGEILAVANRELVDAEQALQLISQRQVSLKGGGVKTYRLSSEKDIRAVVNASAKSLLGRSLDDADLNKMVKLFQQEELAGQQRLARGGVVEEAPSAQQFVQAQIEKDFGDEVDTRKLDAVFGTIYNSLIGGK